MSDMQHLLQRQAAWQKKRAALSWPEKIRMVEQIQESLHQIRAFKNKRPRPRSGEPGRPQE